MQCFAMVVLGGFVAGGLGHHTPLIPDQDTSGTGLKALVMDTKQ